MILDFHGLTKEDADKISQIVQRAKTTQDVVNIDPLSLSMDLMAVHLYDTPLDLDRLLEAKPLDFWHDLAGIINSLDRETGKLKNNFIPRFAKRQ